MSNEEAMFLVYDRDQGDIEECMGIKEAQEKAYEMAINQVPMCDDYETLKTLDQIGIFKLYGSVYVGSKGENLKDTAILVNTLDLFDNLEKDQVQALESELKHVKDLNDSKSETIQRLETELKKRDELLREGK